MVAFQTVQVFVNTFFVERRAQFLGPAGLVEKAFASAGLDYRIAGGLAAYLYAEEVHPDAGRLTKDIDILVRRGELESIAKAVEPFGLQHRNVGGVDMLVQAGKPSGRRAVHMILEDGLGPCRLIGGVRLVPLIELVRKKLTRFRVKDETHIVDLDELGLIAPEMESELSPIQRERLARARSRE